MRFILSTSITLLLIAALTSAASPSQQDSVHLEARAKIANVLEQRWNEPHKTIVHHPHHHHPTPSPHPPPPMQDKPKHKCGSPCHTGEHCESGRCNIGRCVAKPHEGKHGNFCNGGGQCEGGNYCSTGRQRCSTKKPAGQTCVTGNSCQSNLCHQSKCINKNSIPTGKKCEGDTECQTGFCSFLESWKCRSTFPSNHSCSRDAVCSSGRCRRNKCQ